MSLIKINNTKVNKAKENKIRFKRNELLRLTDWTQLSDATVDSNAYSIYRQKLRDIPQQDNFPDNVEWPKL